MSAAEPHRRIIRLQVEGFRRIRAADLKPAANVVKITGRNRSGKTSILESICFALGGASELSSQPVNTDSTSAKVIVEFGDLTIKRGITEDGKTSLVLEGPGGASFPKPQSILDRLTNKRIFDPAEFLNLEPKKRLEVVQKVVGLDFTETEAEIKRIYDERTQVNRDVTRMQAEADALPVPANPPAALFSTEAIDKDIAAADAVNEAASKLAGAHFTQLRRVTNAKARLNGLIEQRDALKKQIEDLQKQAVEIDYRISNGTAVVSTLQGEADAAKVTADAAPHASLAALSQSRDQILAANLCFTQAQERKAAFEAVKKKREASEEMTSAIEHLEKTKKDALKAAKFPVPGMSFTAAGVLLNDHPFEQASAMEQRYASVAMAAALDPAFRVMLLRDASLLDSEALADFTKLAEQFDFQLWLEICASSGEKHPGCIIVDDGRVLHDTDTIPTRAS